MVEWKKLSDISKIIRGNRVTKSDLVENGQYPVISGGVSPLGHIDKYNREPNTITIAQYGSAGYVDMLREKFWANDVCYSVYPEEGVLNYYLYYSLKNKQREIYSLRTNAVPAHLPLKELSSILIPLPSLSEQTRIVGILDTFTSSIENLKEQITQRRKQYEYYRDQLLDLEGKEGTIIKCLVDIVSEDCSLSYGIVQPGDDVADGIPVVRPVDLVDTYISINGLKRTELAISNSYKRTILKGSEILLCVRGTTGVVGLATPELKGSNVTRGIVPISFNNEILKKFVYYQLKSSRLQKDIANKTNGTALRQINVKDLKTLRIVLPSLYEQSRIVSILDTFEASISNLEAQLKEREKQYEYYRNKLLTFE